MRPIWNVVAAVFLAAAPMSASAEEGEEFPLVPEDVEVTLFAREPLVRNPCSLAFDARGRLFVGQGPQYRTPQPETEGDRVDLLLDDDRDGVADRRQTFAEGFNTIQGLAWRGRDLYVANAPDLTVVRDLDGDDVADEYVRLYTGLGNLEHGLHGLTFGPDGRLYFSKGNSKGLNTLDALAPLPFRELWDIPSPEGAPDLPAPVTFQKGAYQKSYHDPRDDWGRQGGVLRCDPGGTNLEIVSRGNRNPWDMAYDDHFQFLGTDNDQTQGDKFFAPFFGAHFGWGHAWSFDWKGDGHLPTVPASGPLFEGSGTGVVWYDDAALPERFRGAFLVNDWLRRLVYVYRPSWDGALMRPEGVRSVEDFEVLASAGGGRAMQGSSGILFDPTDSAIGPEGALYIASWGREYGLATGEDGKQNNAGRIFRFAGKGQSTFLSIAEPSSLEEKSLEDLIADLGSPLEARRVVAQEEMVRRDEASAWIALWKKNEASRLTERQRTWLMWAIGRGDSSPEAIAIFLVGELAPDRPLSQRLQAARIAAFRASRKGEPLPEEVALLLGDPEARLRLAAALAVREAGAKEHAKPIVQTAAIESDRLAFFALWNVMRDLLEEPERRALLADKRPGARLAALLGLLEDGLLKEEDVRPLARDADSTVAALAEEWLEKSGFGVEPLLTVAPPPGLFQGDVVEVTLSTPLKGARIHYTLDGSPPVRNSPQFKKPIRIEDGTRLRAAVLKDGSALGPVVEGGYHRDRTPPYQPHPFVHVFKESANRDYLMNWAGLRPGELVYADRDYRIREVPDSMEGLPYLRMANDNDDSQGHDRLILTLDDPVTIHIGLDARQPAPPAWMGVGEDEGFQETGEVLTADDPAKLRLYAEAFPAGVAVLGGNTDDGQRGGKGNYLVAFERGTLLHPGEKPATVESVLSILNGENRERVADPGRGRDLFLHERGAGCYLCHRLEGRGNVFAPDLSELGSRADARTIVESILDPSATITEGFSLQVFTLKSGEIASGIVLEESAQAVTLGMLGGVKRTVPLAEVASRESPRVSAMPAGFGYTMDAGQVADLTAYLLKNRGGFVFRKAENGLEILLDGRPIATWLADGKALGRRAFVNLRTVSGLPVTRNFPPRKPEDIDPGYKGEGGIIHPDMHPGLWMGFGWIDGNDYWRLKSKVEFDSYLEEETGEGAATFTVRNHYLNESGEERVCTEDTVYRFERFGANNILLSMDATFYSDDHEFAFGDQEESGLAIRVASPIRVKGGNGRILNDRGERNEAGIWGKEFRWIDYAGKVSGKEVGLLIVPHPENPRASWAHSRDYGVLVANPFPKQPKERREPYTTTTVKRGERFRLRYAVLIHESDGSDESDAFDPEEAARQILLRQGAEP